ncbi:hypothetical protein EMIT0P253_260078 [Pseudomonas sp. IT-P253]
MFPSFFHQMNMAKLPMHRDLAGFNFITSSAGACLVSGTPLLSHSFDAKSFRGSLRAFRRMATASIQQGVGVRFCRVQPTLPLLCLNSFERSWQPWKANTRWRMVAKTNER